MNDEDKDISKVIVPIISWDVEDGKLVFHNALKEAIKKIFNIDMEKE